MRDNMILWLLAMASTMLGIFARLGFDIKANLPPDELILRQSWWRKQLWTAAAEFASAPLLGAAVVAMAQFRAWSPEMLAMVAMGAGALGFGVLLDGLRRIVSRKVEAL